MVTIIFDIGGVLEMADSTRRLAKALAERYSIGEEYCVDLYNKHVEAIDRGAFPLRKYVEEINKKFKTSISYEDFVSVLHGAKILNNDVLALAEQLKRKYSLYVLSNNFPENVVFYKKQGFDKIFKKMFISCEIGSIKPEKKIYEVALQQIAEKDKVIFIDDVEKNLETAEKLGMKGIHFTSYGGLLRELKRLGVL